MTSFGQCCKDLNEVLTGDFERLIFVNENGVLFQSVGHLNTDEGVGWFDMAVRFCPFCGTELQTNDRIRAGGEGKVN